MINWLHISDLHLGSEGAITNMMRDELPEYLKELGVKCDYVFCTGDIRTANVSPNVFTDEMADYLKSICDAVQTSVDRLYIVAGNHDVDRDVDSRHDVIRKVFYDSERYYHPDNGIIEPEEIQKQSDDEYLVDGGATLEDLEDLLGIEFPDEDFETVNGFLLYEHGRLPEEGESFKIEYQGYEFIPVKIEDNRIITVKITKLKEEE